MDKKFIKAFEEIRDIPYRIPLSAHDTDDCCSGKANRLMTIFEMAGKEVRYRVCSFLWSDLNLPNSLQQTPHEDLCTHVYLEVKDGDRWIVIDPTWDRALEEVLPVGMWDGKKDTVLGVPVRDTFSPEESSRCMQESKDIQVIEDDLKKNGSFYKIFNKWLEECRNKYVSIK